MIHWNPGHLDNKCNYGFDNNAATAGYILEATCLDCLNFALTFCHSGIRTNIEKRIDQLEYRKDFEELINSGELGKND